MKKHYRNENDCLNCGATLQGKYCHVCGQENLELKESFGHMMNHAISDYFHFDHQFFHTLKPLLFKPGFLTNEYMGGRRAQYLHPVKMYIFISIVYFLVLFQSGAQLGIVRDSSNDPVATQKGLDSAKKAISSNAYIPNVAKKQIEHDLDKQKAAEKNNININVVDNRKTGKWFRPHTKDTSYAEYLANQKKLVADQQDNFIDRAWNRKVFTYKEKYGPGAQEQFLEDVQHNAPKMMFFLLPILALILRVTFFRNKKFYVEHLIYAFHLFCCLFLFLGISILVKMFIPHSWVIVIDIIGIIEFIYIVWYVYRSLRVVYQRGRFRTMAKMVGMSFMYFLAFMFCTSALFIVTTML